MPVTARALPPGAAADDLAVECLSRSVGRELAGIRSVVLGLCFMLVIHWGLPTLHWVVAAIVLRFLVLLHNLWVVRTIERLGARQALARRLDRRLVLGLAWGGLAWGLLAWGIGRPGEWTLPDQLTAMLLLVSSPLTLITTSYLWRGMLAFNAGLWGMALLRFASEPQITPAIRVVLISIGFFLAVLYLYGRQLHQQALEGVIADLRNRHLGAELAQANRQLHEALAQAVGLSKRDPLTHSLNRRAFLERAEQEGAAMRREGLAGAVLMLDLDHFKAINDQHGHVAGDKVLTDTCAAVQALLREVDVLSRWGGEEFIALLPRTDLAAAERVAERIRERLSQLSDADWPAGLRISVSIGVARWAPGADLIAAIEHADQWLYAAKAAGRNRVRVAPL